MSAKLIGYLLLSFGLIVIAVSALNIYQVFTGVSQPFSVVHTSGLSLTLPQISTPVQVATAKDLDQMTNLTFTYLLYSFLVSVGFKLASLGSQFLRPCPSKL